MADHLIMRNGKLVRVVKRPGDDWVVQVRLISENEIYPVTIFGAVDEAAAISDALSSFSSHDKADLEIVVVSRLHE